MIVFTACQIWYHYAPYKFSKTLSYGKKLLFFGTDLEGIKDLQWRKILQRSKNDNICWWIVKLSKHSIPPQYTKKEI